MEDTRMTIPTMEERRQLAADRRAGLFEVDNSQEES
jgi:hypothetical protein